MKEKKEKNKHGREDDNLSQVRKKKTSKLAPIKKDKYKNQRNLYTEDDDF